MDGITRKRMKCDCHIAKKGYFGWKKIGEALGMGKGLYTGIPDYLPKKNCVLEQHNIKSVIFFHLLQSQNRTEEKKLCS